MEPTATVTAPSATSLEPESAAVRARQLAAARRRATALLAGVTVLFVAVTATGAHGILLGYVQAAVFVPLQLPPQSDPSLVQAVRDPCGVPLTATQVPTEPETSQAWHCPPQALLQHTPSTQLPLPHWLDAVQAPPLPFFGTHAPALQ